MSRQLAIAILALIVGLGGSLGPLPGTPTVSATSLVGLHQLVPGTVNRTSLNLEASYDARIRIGWGTRNVKVESTATIRNTSGMSIDRVELNTVAARLGGMTLTGAFVDGQAVEARVSDQTIVVPLGGVLPSGASVAVEVRYAARLRTSLTGSNWMFTKANGVVNLYRWLPWVSRAIKFERPNFGDPFVTPTSPYVKVRVVPDRALTLATTGERVATHRLEQVFEARNVRDFTLTAATDFITRTTTVGSTKVIGVARTAATAARLRDEGARAFGKLKALLGPYPYPSFRVVESAGGTAMESPALVWLPYGLAASRTRYLVTHETAHQWFYGLVGADQAREPFTDEAVADFLARYALGMKRASRCGTARLDLTIYQYSSSCYYEVVYIQGGNFLDDLRVRMGATAFWRGMRAYVADNRFGIAPTKSLLATLDAHTSLNLVPRYETRFPRLY